MEDEIQTDLDRVEQIRTLLEPFAGRTLAPDVILHLGFALEDMRTIVRHNVDDENCCREKE